MSENAFDALEDKQNILVVSARDKK